MTYDALLRRVLLEWATLGRNKDDITDCTLIDFKVGVVYKKNGEMCMAEAETEKWKSSSAKVRRP